MIRHDLTKKYNDKDKDNDKDKYWMAAMGVMSVAVMGISGYSMLTPITITLYHL